MRDKKAAGKRNGGGIGNLISVLDHVHRRGVALNQLSRAAFRNDSQSQLPFGFRQSAIWQAYHLKAPARPARFSSGLIDPTEIDQIKRNPVRGFLDGNP